LKISGKKWKFAGAKKTIHEQKPDPEPGDREGTAQGRKK
jgi:hypothetical protein